MNYQEIAKQVHQIVKNPQNYLSKKIDASLTEINGRELRITQNGAIQYDYSGSGLNLVWQ